MEQLPPLDDLTLFVDVAREGGLAGAARRTGGTVPTISRKMTALERQLGRKLFERGPRGYALTAEGRAVLEQLQDLKDIQARLTRSLGQPDAVRVRVTAGAWTASYLAKRLGEVWRKDDPWRLEFVESTRMLDIARRDADIGIRSRRPDQPWLAGRRTSKVEFAIYAASDDVRGFVALSADGPLTPSVRWVRGNHGGEIITTACEEGTLVDLAVSGVGRVVMPTFVASRVPGLKQVAPVIPELSHDEWLVCHHEARHDPPIRAALEAVATLLTSKSLPPA
ncbi:MAG: LysR family transcriptional regulator [Rhodobacteraceae bacterium]|nr:LysR family transcriptional regulator [Paracoccaceae bacterium]